jgi:3',5'-cyclic AMP phosphodiesterase CpdA
MRDALRNLSTRVILALAALLLVSGCQTPLGAPPARDFTFVQMCDPQLGMNDVATDSASLTQAVARINALAPAFVIVCGDLVVTANTNSFAEVRQILSGLVMPWYVTPGNHDVGNAPTPASLALFRAAIGPDRQTFEYGGVRFLLVDMPLWKAPVEGETAAQDAWVAQTLSAAHRKGRPVIVAGHQPPFEGDPNEGDSYANLPRETRQRVLAEYATNGVVAVLGGHLHRSVALEHAGMQIVCGETTSKNFDGRPLGFRLWRVRPGTPPEHTFVPLTE